MPVRRRIDKRRQDLSEEAQAWLAGDLHGEFWIFGTERELAETWAAHRDGVLADWIAEYPGTRPAHWWTYDAPRQPLGTFPGVWYDGERPEPRLRLGGIGTPAHEVLACVPYFPFGLPASWLTESDVARCGRGVAIDADDPPTFESQAAYLQRHGLLLTGEKRRLKAAYFEPERVEQ
jgi:hypothetical protein